MRERILVIDDDEAITTALRRALSFEGYAVQTAPNGEEGLARARDANPDLVILDVLMPGLDGFETCRRVKADPAIAHIPVVIVTALDDVDDLVKGFEAGADDFLIRPINGLELLARVRSQLQRKQQYDRVRVEALIDSLTGAFNRRYFDAHASRIAARCHAARRPIAILIVDLDDLKRINDTHGHLSACSPTSVPTNSSAATTATISSLIPFSPTGFEKTCKCLYAFPGRGFAIQ